MAQVLQRGRLNQVAIHNLDMLSTQVRMLVQRYNENYLHNMEITLSTWHWKQPLHSRFTIVRLH